VEGLARTPLCGDEKLPGAFEHRIAEKVGKAQDWLRRAADGGKPKKMDKLLGRADRVLRWIETKAGRLERRGKLSGACNQAIARLVDERRQLVAGIST
jgi:hypothetical protein